MIIWKHWNRKRTRLRWKSLQKASGSFCVERGSSGGSEISSGFIDAVPGQKEEAGDFCREWYLQDEDDPTAATALIYTWIAGGRLKEAQKIVDRWMEKEEGYTEENAEIFGAASLLRTVSGIYPWKKLKVTEDRCKEIVIRQDRDDGAVKMGDGIYEDHNGAWAEP